MKSKDEIQKMHDTLVGALEVMRSQKLRIFTKQEMEQLAAAADALCFVLDHANDNLLNNAVRITRALAEEGYVLELISPDTIN